MQSFEKIKINIDEENLKEYQNCNANDRQYNDQTSMEIRTNNDLENTEK